MLWKNPIGEADLYLMGGKVSGCTVGLHFTGSMGGVNVDNCDIIGNATNCLIDQSDVAVSNREFFFGHSCAFDTAGVSGNNQGVGLSIQDTSPLVFLDHTWIASCGTLIETGSTYTGTLIMRAPYLFNAFTNGGATNGNAVQIGNINCRVICTSPVLNNIQGFGFICTAGQYRNMTVNIPVIVSNVANLFDPSTFASTILDVSATASDYTIGIQIAASGTYNLPYFSGMLIVSNTVSGSVGLFLCGSGTVSTINWTATVGGTLTYSAGISGYVFTNTTATSNLYSFMPFRIRAGS